MKILNLDELIKDEIKVVFKGKEYILPGDIEVKTSMENMKYYQLVREDPNSPDVLENGIKQLHKVFQKSYPELTLDAFSEGMTLKQYSVLFKFIFGVEEEEEEIKKKEDSES